MEVGEVIVQTFKGYAKTGKVIPTMDSQNNKHARVTQEKEVGMENNPNLGK